MGPLKTDELYVEVSALLPDAAVLIERIGTENQDYVLLVTEVRQVAFDCTLVVGCKENGQVRRMVFGNGATLRIVDADI